MKALPIILLFGLGLAGGWLTNRSQKTEKETAEAPRPSPRMARNQSGGKQSALPGDVAARLAAVHAAPNQAERLRAVIQLAWELPVSEMPRWFENHGFGLRDNGELGVFNEIARRRWMEEDPEGLMGHAMLRNWTNFSEIAARWGRLDPDRALEFMKNQRDSGKAKRLQTALLPCLAESRPDETLAVIRSVGGNSDSQWHGVFSRLAEHHPDKLAATLVDWPASLRKPAEIALTREGLSRNFAGELARLLDSPDGKDGFASAFQNHQNVPRLEDSILRNIHRIPADWLESVGSSFPWNMVQGNPERWLEVDFETLGLFGEKAARFRNAALSHLTHREPEKALSYLAGLDFTGDHYKNTFQNAVLALAGKDAAAAEQWLESVPEEASEFYESLSAELDKKLNPPAPGDPSEKLLESLHTSVKNSDAWRFVNEFSQASLEIQREFMEELSRLPAAELGETGLGIIAQSGVRNLPRDLAGKLVTAAVSHQQAQGEGDSGETENQGHILIRQTAELAVHWVLEESAAATRWMAGLPPGESRQWALRNVAANWQSYDAPAARAWISTLSATEQQDVRQHLDKPR